MAILWDLLVAAVGVGFGALAAWRFHGTYRVNNPRWLRFAGAIGIGVPLLLALAWLVGEFNAFYLTGALSFAGTLAVGELLWRPRASAEVTSRSAS